MKAKVIETGEIVEVEFYCSAYYKEKGQGPDRREWDEDELEFIPNPNRPKMVPLDKVCEWLKCNLPYSSKPPYQVIEDLRKAMEE